MKNSVKVDFDQYTDNYNELLRESTKFFSSSEQYFAQYKVDLVRAMAVGRVTRILEYGCGIGRNIRYLQAAFDNAEIVGTDISKESLAIAAEENPDSQFVHEADGIDIGKFDLIFVAGVFHHIPPQLRKASTHLLADRLSPEGLLCIFEHNPFNPVTRRIVNTCPYDTDAVLLKPAELRSHLLQAGLAPRKQAYCLFIPPNLGWLAPIERYLGWMPLGGQYWISAGHSE